MSDSSKKAQEPNKPFVSAIRDSSSFRKDNFKKRVSFHSEVDGRISEEEEKKEDWPNMISSSGGDTPLSKVSRKFSKKGTKERDKYYEMPALIPVEHRVKQNTSSELADSPRTPLICLSEGVSKKASVCSLSNWAALSLTLDGRDKLTKTLQYLCRLLAWWYSGSPTCQDVPFSNLYKSLGNSRKAFRLGRFLVEFQKLRELVPTFWKRITPTIPPQPGWRLLGSFASFSKSSDSRTTHTMPLWKSLGLSCKLLGLAGFWLGDNLLYLSGAGFLSHKFLKDKTKAQIFSMRCYFFAALAGLLVNYNEIKVHRRKLQESLKSVQNILEEESDFNSSGDEDDEMSNSETHSKIEIANKAHKELTDAMDKLQEDKAKQFILFLAFLKVGAVNKELNGQKEIILTFFLAEFTQSTSDVIVFSNNPGVDLHKTYRGRKMHEGFHCVCGLISAGTVLFNSFPIKPTIPESDARLLSISERKELFRKKNFASSNWYFPL